MKITGTIDADVAIDEMSQKAIAQNSYIYEDEPTCISYLNILSLLIGPRAMLLRNPSALPNYIMEMDTGD